MFVQKLTQGLLVYFTMDELSREGLSAETVNKETLLPLIEKALHAGSETLPAYPELQLFQSTEELLIFVRPYLPEKNHFSIHNAVHS